MKNILECECAYGSYYVTYHPSIHGGHCHRHHQTTPHICTCVYAIGAIDVLTLTLLFVMTTFDTYHPSIHLFMEAIIIIITLIITSSSYTLTCSSSSMMITMTMTIINPMAWPWPWPSYVVCILKSHRAYMYILIYLCKMCLYVFLCFLQGSL